MPARELPFVIRPECGSSRLRKHASIRVAADGITATDRRGWGRTFAFDGTDDAPYALVSGGGNWELGLTCMVDGQGRSLLLIDDINWPAGDTVDFQNMAQLHFAPHPKQRPPDRPDVFSVQDAPYLKWAGIAFAAGMGAVSLRWLHIAPEAIIDFVAIPILVVFAFLLVEAKRANPGAKMVAQWDEDSKTTPEEDAHVAELIKKYDHLMETEPDAGADADPEAGKAP